MPFPDGQAVRPRPADLRTPKFSTNFGAVLIQLVSACVSLAPRKAPLKMAKKTVEFEAHKVVKQEKEISFTKKDGTPVDFEAKVPTKVPVHVKFKANVDKKD